MLCFEEIINMQDTSCYTKCTWTNPHRLVIHHPLYTTDHRPHTHIPLALLSRTAHRVTPNIVLVVE
jgi:hypothetical protein